MHVENVIKSLSSDLVDKDTLDRLKQVLLEMINVLKLIAKPITKPDSPQWWVDEYQAIARSSIKRLSEEKLVDTKSVEKPPAPPDYVQLPKAEVPAPPGYVKEELRDEMRYWLRLEIARPSVQTGEGGPSQPTSFLPTWVEIPKQQFLDIFSSGIRSVNLYAGKTLPIQ